jgi:hypothetical protein
MSYLLVGLDYVKDRWAFQKEDGSEHKEHIQACALQEIMSRDFRYPENCSCLP